MQLSSDFKVNQVEKEQKPSENEEKFREMIRKLEDCYNALRDSMLHNFVYIQFYKDIQMYVSSNYFEDEKS